MLKQSATSRNQRPKSFKVNHVLQICLLLAISVWVINQIRHYHKKSPPLEDTATSLSWLRLQLEADQNGPKVVKLGRKGLDPRIEEEEEEEEEEVEGINESNAEENIIEEQSEDVMIDGDDRKDGEDGNEGNGIEEFSLVEDDVKEEEEDEDKLKREVDVLR